MATTSFDCIVIGSGPGGYVAAIRGAQLGLKVAVIEKDKIGGRCLNYACIPAKAVLRSADLISEIEEAGSFGVKVGEPSVDFAGVSARRDEVIATLVGGVEMLLKKNKVEVIHGAATLTGGRTVSVDGKELETPKAIILATGSVARTIPGASFGGAVIATEQAWALDKLPSKMVVVGSGASGTEIASAYARFGVEVELFEALDRVLPSEDADISRLVERGLTKQGITVHTSTLISEIKDGKGSASYSHAQASGKADWLVIAAGRGADVEGLGLDAAAVAVDESGLISVDGQQRTSADGIFAIGDLVHGPALAHKASEEGIIAAETIAGESPAPLQYIDIPRATFCMPNVGSFGLTEAEAKEQGFDLTVGKVPYGAVGAGTLYGDRDGLVKIIGDKRYGELLGAHIVGSKAVDLIQELVVAKLLEGGYPEVARIVHGHPTISEAVLEAARAADGWLIHG